MIGDPDPYTATMNALQFFRVDDIIISTLPETRSGWLRADLIERVRKASNIDGRARRRRAAAPPETAAWTADQWKPPRSATRTPTTTTTTTTARRRPTAARASSPSCLGMLLFIICEIMVFGAFFTAYFFIRVVAEGTSGSRSTATSCRSPSRA